MLPVQGKQLGFLRSGSAPVQPIQRQGSLIQPVQVPQRWRHCLHAS